MKRIKVKGLLSAGILLLSLLLMAGSASSAGFQNSTIISGTTDTDTSIIGTAINNQSNGGYITQIDIYTGSSQTQKWQGYYGNVSGNIYLNDSSDNSMYKWIVNLTDTFVYATTNDTLPSWDALDVADGATLDTTWNFSASSDNITKTYMPSTGDQTFAGQSVTDPLNVTTTAGYRDFVIAGGDATDKKNVLWAGTIYYGQNNFKDQPADYELLVPVDPNGPDTYYFYIELL